MRLCAQAYAKFDDTGQRLPFSTEEKQYYHKVKCRDTDKPKMKQPLSTASDTMLCNVAT